MPQYLLTARDVNGKPVTERVDTSSADQAVEILIDRGFTEIKLLTDDVMALYTNQKSVEPVVSPADYRRLRTMPQWLIRTWIITKGVYRSNWYWQLGMLALFGYQRYEQFPWRWTDTGCLVFLLGPFVLALAAGSFNGASGRYRRLIDAVAWGRWEKVLELADHVNAPIATDSIIFEKAKALAALGRLDEALELVKRFDDGHKMPLWLYWSRLSSVYASGDHRDESKAALEKALEIAPENVTLLAEKAYSEVWRSRDPHLAAEYLSRIQGHAVSDMVQLFIDRAEGLIELEKGSGTEARELLEKAFNGFTKYRHSTALIGRTLDFIHAQLALAYAAEGDIDEARRHYALARPRLVALKKHEEITRCEQALGLTANE